MEEPLTDAIAALHGAPAQRAAALTSLGQSGNLRAAEPLRQVLAEGDPEERALAAWALGKIRDSGAVQLLCRGLQDADADVCRQAAWALGEIGSPEAVSPLLKALDAADWVLRLLAVRALGRIGDIRAAEALQTILAPPPQRRGRMSEAERRRQPTPEGAVLLQRAAARAIGRLDHPTAIPWLVDAFLSPRLYAETELFLGEQVAKEVSREAAMALGRRNEPEALEVLRQGLDREATQRPAIAGLEAAGNRAVELLIQALATHPDEGVRTWCAQTLGEIGDPCAIEPLVQALRDPGQWVARDAINALSRFGSAAGEPLLRELAAEDAAGAGAVVTALSKIREPRAVAPLLSLLDDPALHKAATIALGEIGDRRAVAPLCAALESAEETWVTWILQALGKLGDPQSLGTISRCLDSESVTVRIYAAEALGRIRNPQTVSVLSPLLESPISGLRVTAALSLRKLLATAALPALERCYVAEPSDTDARSMLRSVVDYTRVMTEGDPPLPQPGQLLRGQLVPLREGLTHLSTEQSTHLCSCCGGFCHALLTVPGEQIGRPGRVIQVVRCLDCYFCGPHFVRFRGETPIRSEWEDGQHQSFMGEGAEHTGRASLMWVPYEPDPDYDGERTRANGEPEWVQNDEWPDCPDCGTTMEFVLQVASSDLDVDRQKLDLGYPFRLGIEHYATLFLFECEACAITATVTQCS